MNKPILVLFCLLILASCSQGKVVHNKELEELVASEMMESTTEIDLNTMTDFKWEEAYIFPPYSSEEEMKERLGETYTDSSNIEYRDDINLLVFMNDSEVVQYAEVARKYGDIVTKSNEPISPSKAILEIKRFASVKE